jgi:signal transduction histidine kinase
MIGVATTDPSQLDLEDHQRLVDVTALCLLNTRRQEAQARQNRELQQQDLLRRSFLSYVTHEFRTPLASLQTSFELIQEAEVMRGLDDPYQRLLVNVNRSIAILGQLINDMAEAANLSAGGVVLDRTETPPAAIVYPVIETTSPLSRLKNQILEVDIRPGLPNLMADARRLEQVLTNMVSNAIKYTPPGGTIRTVVSQEEGLIKFAVSDSGRGIPREDLDRVFDPFFRVPQQSNDRTPGTGLGLALAKSLVELHGGNIWAESEPKKGSTFFFTIPLG